MALVTTVLGALSGCGYTKEEWGVVQDQLARAKSGQLAAQQMADDATTELGKAKDRLQLLEDKMRALGIDLESTSRIGDVAASLAERERALAEYRAKAARIEEARARFDLLRTKVAELDAGFEVRVRKNRIVIVLPNDAVFDGKDKLKKEAKEALGKLAAVLKGEPTLSTRDFQIAGYVDVVGKGGDAVASSLAKAQRIANFLVDPETGGMQKAQISVAGYGDADPVASNDTDEGKAKNRRCEIVLVPAAGEVLELRALLANLK
ncbi:MAG: OmpA family protein [Polyangiaceae bacterium]